MAILRTPEERTADPFVKASRLMSLLRCAICAEDTTVNTEVVFGDDDKGILTTLEVAERLAHELQRDVERMQTRLNEGVWMREDDSRKGA